LFPVSQFASETLRQAGKSSFSLNLQELADHGGVIGFAHHPFRHAEENVVLLKDMLFQKRNVSVGGIGELTGVERLGLTRPAHPTHAVSPQNVLVQHHAYWSAVFGNAPLFQNGEEHFLLLCVVALIGELLEKPGCPLRVTIGDGLALFDPSDSLFEQLQPTYDQFVFGNQTFSRFHDAFSFHCSQVSEIAFGGSD